MENFNMDEIRQALAKIKEEKQAANQTTDATKRQQRVARLIVLLNKMEKELTTIDQTLQKMLVDTARYNPRSPLLQQIQDKLARVASITAKIQKARLNLNYYFI